MQWYKSYRWSPVQDKGGGSSWRGEELLVRSKRLLTDPLITQSVEKGVHSWGRYQFLPDFCWMTLHFNPNRLKSFFLSFFLGVRRPSLITGLTPEAGSIFRPLSQTHISEREFKNSHVFRFCSVFQVISGNFSLRRKLTSASTQKRRNTPDSESFFLKKRPWKRFSTNVLIRGEMNPLHKHKIMSVGYQVKQILKSHSWKLV